MRSVKSENFQKIKNQANHQETILAMGEDPQLKQLAIDFLRETAKYKYSYNFSWLGRPIIQFPQDMIAVQEILWLVKPDLIIETGIARGGSLIFSASILELLGGKGEVIGVDIEIRQHNRREIKKHPLSHRIKLIQGSSTDPAVVAQIRRLRRNKKQVLVMLDSDHSHDHVLRELELYSPLVTQGSYLIVFDTAIEDMPEHFYPGRPWTKGNNPKTSVWEFLKHTDRFVVDREIEEKLLITTAPNGYLKCVKD